jgi:hypothetical protein
MAMMDTKRKSLIHEVPRVSQNNKNYSEQDFRIKCFRISRQNNQPLKILQAKGNDSAF